MVILQNKTELDKINCFNKRDGKICLGYYRLYYRNGWNIVWFPNENEISKPEKAEIDIVNEIIEYIAEKAPIGMNVEFKDFLRKTAEPSPNGRYYFFADNTDFNYLIEFNAKYGNNDYPVRIYLYRNKL